MCVFIYIYDYKTVTTAKLIHWTDDDLSLYCLYANYSFIDMFYNNFQWHLHDYVINVATIMLRRHKKDLIICSKVTVVLNIRHSHNFNFLFDRFNLLNLDKKIKNIKNLCIELTICILLCVCVCVLVSVYVCVC